MRNVVAAITDSSEVLSGLCETDDLVVVGAVYDLPTGRVDWL